MKDAAADESKFFDLLSGQKRHEDVLFIQLHSFKTRRKKVCLTIVSADETPTKTVAQVGIYY